MVVARWNRLYTLGVGLLPLACGGGTPPTAGSVDIANTAFNPETVVVQVNGTVTWTWSDKGIAHNVTYTAAPGSLPASSPQDQTTGTFSTTFMQVGTYKYMCTKHPQQMSNGVVTVVH